MKTHDQLVSMSEDEREAYLKDEVESIIKKAKPNQVLHLRKLQAECDGIRRKVKNPQVKLEMMYSKMIDSLCELNETLKEIKNE